MAFQEIRRGIQWMPLLMTLAGVGPAAAAPFQSGNVLISTANSLHEYTPAGAWVRTVPIPYPGGTRPTTESARDLVVDANGQAALYNGTFDPYLSQYAPDSGAWTHTTHMGWSTVNNVSYGGLARFENFLFATDMTTYGTDDTPKGLIRFDQKGSAPVRFADTVEFIDVTVGQDGLLYGLASNEYTVRVYDPATLALLRTFNLASGVYLRGLAVGATGELYGASWDDHIYRLSPSGAQLGRIYSGTYDLIDIDLSEQGTLVVGARSGKVLFTTPQLSSISSFSVGTSPAFVTFVTAPPPPPPPPAPGNLLVSSGNVLTEYTSAGQIVWTVPIPSNDRARDLTVSAPGRVEIYNGTFDPTLSRYEVAMEAWQHWTYEGWSTVNNVSYGGIASTPNAVFVTDMTTYGTGDTPRGLVRFDLATGTAQRFADSVDFIDVTLGLDGLLYALDGNEYTVRVYDPATLALVRTVNLPPGVYVRGLTASATGELYGASWDDHIYRFSASGVQLGRVYSGVYDLIDIDISPVTQQVAVGSRFGTVILTDLELGNLRSFSAGGSEAFVSFTVPAAGSN